MSYIKDFEDDFIDKINNELEDEILTITPIENYNGIVNITVLVNDNNGEIDSEMRQEELPLKKVNENHYRILGAYSLAEFNESFQSTLPENDYDTVGGYVFGLFGRIPRSGESTTIDRFKFRVEKMKGSRILSLFLTLMTPHPLLDKEQEEDPEN